MTDEKRVYGQEIYAFCPYMIHMAFPFMMNGKNKYDFDQWCGWCFEHTTQRWGTIRYYGTYVFRFESQQDAALFKLFF